MKSLAMRHGLVIELSDEQAVILRGAVQRLLGGYLMTELTPAEQRLVEHLSRHLWSPGLPHLAPPAPTVRATTAGEDEGDPGLVDFCDAE